MIAASVSTVTFLNVVQQDLVVENKTLALVDVELLSKSIQSSADPYSQRPENSESP